MKTVWIVILVLGLLAVGSDRSGAVPAAREGKVFVFDRFNRSYEDLKPEIPPIRQGLLTIRLSSPRHRIVLERHRLQIRPDGGGDHDASVQAEFEGSGDLIADLDLGGLTGRLEDQVEVPPQRKSIRSKVRLEPSEQGYRLTVIDAPEPIVLEVRTGLADRLIQWCQLMSWVPASVLDCTGLNLKLTTITFPLPAGESFFIRSADLTAREREEIDAYLKAAGGRAR